jgi:hypothetical protein
MILSSSDYYLWYFRSHPALGDPSDDHETNNIGGINTKYFWN